MKSPFEVFPDRRITKGELKRGLQDISSPFLHKTRKTKSALGWKVSGGFDRRKQKLCNDASFGGHLAILSTLVSWPLRIINPNGHFCLWLLFWFRRPACGRRLKLYPCLRSECSKNRILDSTPVTINFSDSE